MSDTVVNGRDADTRRHDGWVRAWPLNKPALAQLGIGAGLLFAVTTVAGLLFMWLLDDGPVGDWDRSVARWLEDRRTPALNRLTANGEAISDTFVKVALVALCVVVMIALWRRWHDAVFLATAVIVEASIFVTSSFIVGRDRPPVEKLDPPAPSGSFPSGHTAAAVAFYAGVYLIVRWHTRNRVVRGVFLAVAVAAPLIVGFSRAFRGMHHAIDVVAGLLLGIASLYIVHRAVATGVEEIDRDSDDSVPERLRHLDLTTTDDLIPVHEGVRS
jgi:undecaprenyl-diphosphatase